MTYGYDVYGRKASLTYPNGNTVYYGYDQMDRLVSVTGLQGEVTTYTMLVPGRPITMKTM